MRGKKITLAEAAAIADKLRISIAESAAKTSELGHAQNEVHELEIAFDRCGCEECFDRYERAKRSLERLVLNWYHAKEEDFS